ncbi:MAG: DUF1232 domain-containing protein [Actinomycetota bacterium]
MARSPIPPAKIILAVAGAVVYILSPIDIAPEIFLGPLGLVDDAGVLAAALLYVRRESAKRRAADSVIDISETNR